MKTAILVLSLALTTSAASALAATHAARANPNDVKQTKLICKTGSERRPANQPLRLYFNYNMPLVFEPEDPTVPYGRQVVVLAGKPVMQLFFERSSEPAGENGENLQPMQCAFAKRGLRNSEPNQVQILLGQSQPHWLTQTIGQRPGPAQLSFERASIAPAGDWSIASQFEKVFSIELDDTRTFVTGQLPKAIH
ncbi:MAG: hypothetical protein ACXWQO_02700 [Bdellovibrionota bacterium]